MRTPYAVMKRIALVAAAAIALLVAAAAPASAHSEPGIRPTNYRSRVVSMTPPLPGVTARVIELGNKLELTNRTTQEITVLGYEGEPYLRVGPAGVFENLHSEATYINRTRQGGSIPAGVDTGSDTVPKWRKVSNNRFASWHDHRIHWMGAKPPPVVAQSSATFHHLSQRNVVLRFNDQSVAVAVDLDWVPPSSGLPWLPLLIALFLFGGIVVAAPRWSRPSAVLLIILVLVDIAHTIGFEIPHRGNNLTKTLQFFAGNVVSLAVWFAALLTTIALKRRRGEAAYGVILVALLVALIGGAANLSSLWKSQLPTAGPRWLTQIEVVISLGLGAGLVVGGFARLVRERTPIPRVPTTPRLSILVSGLSDDELKWMVRNLDGREILDVAFRDLAIRAAPLCDALTGRSIQFVATTGQRNATWVLAQSNATGELQVVRRHEVSDAEIHASFEVFLRLLAGTVTMSDAVALGEITAVGDRALLALFAVYLPEPAVVPEPTNLTSPIHTHTNRRRLTVPLARPLFAATPVPEPLARAAAHLAHDALDRSGDRGPGRRRGIG